MFGKRKEGNQIKALYRRIDGKELKYVTKRDLEKHEEAVLGKEGRLCVNNEKLAIMCNGHLVFEGLLENIKAGELMSLEGVTIDYTHPDTGELHKYVAYYKYYRKV